MISHEEIVIETMPDTCPDTSYLQQEGFEDRLRQAENGDFGFMGVIATCTLIIGIGQTDHVILHRFKSPGIWGVETDSDPVYVQQLFDDERSVLLAMLNAIGCQRSGPTRSAS